MHRIDSATKAADLFGAGKDGFRDGEKAAGISATDLTAAFFNDLQENMAGVVEGVGIALVKGDYTQLATAIKAIFQKSSAVSSAAGGTVDAITADYSPAITALTDNLLLIVRAAGANTSATPTFTPNLALIAAKPIVKGHGQPLVAGDISGAGFRAELQYDQVLDNWVLLNPTLGVNGVSRNQQNIFTKGNSGAEAALPAITGTVTLDLATSNNFGGTLTGNIVLANPSSMPIGQSGVIRLVNDATPRTIAYGSYWKAAGGYLPALTATAGATDALVYYVESATRIVVSALGDTK